MYTGCFSKAKLTICHLDMTLDATLPSIMIFLVPMFSVSSRHLRENDLASTSSISTSISYLVLTPFIAPLSLTIVPIPILLFVLELATFTFIFIYSSSGGCDAGQRHIRIMYVRTPI